MTSDLNPQRHLANHVDDPDVTARAQSNLARTARDGDWTRDEIVQVMEALGWSDYTAGATAGARVTDLGERKLPRKRTRRETS